MANIVIVSTSTIIKVNFNDYSLNVGFTKGAWIKSILESVRLESSETFVSMIIETGEVWKLTYNASDYFQVDSIDGIAPTSNSDLYDKLAALL